MQIFQRKRGANRSIVRQTESGVRKQYLTSKDALVPYSLGHMSMQSISQIALFQTKSRKNP